MSTIGFQYFSNGYYCAVGIKIRGQIGKKYIYRIVKNTQHRYPYKKPYNPNSPLQQKYRFLYKHAILSWQSLPETEKAEYRKKEHRLGKMSGFNFYIREYINTYK